MPTITKNNYKKYTRKNLLPLKDGGKPNDAVSQEIFEQNNRLLGLAKGDYDSLDWMRDLWARCWRYYNGDQLGDLIPNPDGCGAITEREYMKKQGIVPQTLNIIRKGVKTILGVYRQSRYEPLVISRDREEQKLGEMMTVTMEYAYQNLNLPEENARAFEGVLVGAWAGFKIGFDIDDDRQTSDVEVMRCDINRTAWDSNTSGQYFKNISRITYLHDMTSGQVLSKFAHTKAQRAKIEDIYGKLSAQYPVANQQFDSDSRDKRRKIDFFHALEPNLWRVIEIWSKEQRDSYEFHDIAKGIQIFVEDENDPEIKAENNRRMSAMLEAGGSAEDAALIEYVGYHVRDVWVVRYLTPDGYVLHMEDTPYAHGSHPFVLGAYPLTNGEIHSLVSDEIDAQRVFNITFMRNQFIRMNAAKGFGIVNKKILDKSNVSLDAFQRQYTSADGLIGLEWDAGEGNDIFVRYSDNSANVADENTMQQCMDIIGKLDGTNNTLTGERTNSGTPASLYMQQTSNSSNNITDQIEWYNGLIQKRDYKIMQVIQQYYQDRRYMDIAGKDYSEESKWYDPEKARNSQFDLALVENQSQGIFRATNENLLFQLLQLGAIDPQTYLESTTAPFADKLLERIKSKQEEAEEAQAQQAAQNGMIQQ